jgi:hypothetical protein
MRAAFTALALVAALLVGIAGWIVYISMAPQPPTAEVEPLSVTSSP